MCCCCCCCSYQSQSVLPVICQQGMGEVRSCMQVSVKGSADKPETWYDEFCSRCPDAALKDKLRKMCGVGSLRTELQQVQLNHMLLNHPAITANISRLLLQVTAKMDVGPVPCQHLCPAVSAHGAMPDTAGMMQ